MRTGIFIILILFNSLFVLQGQISRGGSPMLTKGPRMAMPVFRLDREEIEMMIIKSITQDSLIDGKKPLTIAVDQKTDINPKNSGKWIETGNGYKVWRLEVLSEEAKGLAVYFNSYKLEKDAMLFIYDPGMDKILGGFNHLNNKKSGILQTAFIPGERIIIELQVPVGKPYGELSIGGFSHAFVDIFGGSGKKDEFFGLSGNCEVDINCPAGSAWQVVKHSVCRIIFKRSEFTTDLCTGTLINNAREDGKPFFYTANHCIKTVFEAETAVLYFNYESEECNGNDGDATMTLSGAEVLATSDSLDFSLLLLSEDPPELYNPYFAGWSRTDHVPMSGVAIHHPRGDVKKISRDRDMLLTEYQDEDPPEWLYKGSTPGAFWRVEEWETGATEGGSSGCPIFNPSRLIVGNLTGGDASCGYPRNDYFSKFHMNWDYYPEPERQLKYWLDPLNSGFEYVSGFDPFGITDTLDLDIFTIYPNPGKGQFTIHTDSLVFGSAQIRLFNSSGQIMADYKLNNVETFHFVLPYLENGIYYLEIIAGEYREQKKLVILK